MEIRNAPPEAATRNVVRLHPDDNVVIASRPLTAGNDVDGIAVPIRQDIAAGHKVATKPIAIGEAILKYGQVIGIATVDIAAGAHVHTHNVAVSSERAASKAPVSGLRNEKSRSFMGYVRANGRVGIRNHVCILTSVNCSATVARAIADRAERSGLLARFPNVDGVVAITHSSGCGMAASGEGFDTLRRTLWGTAANPNFAAVLLIGLGCEVLQVDAMARDSGLAGSTAFDVFTIQDAGGTAAAIEDGLTRLEPLLALANEARRTEVPAGRLVLGLQCGGSDAWSGLTSNPALGNASDRLVALGGTVILSETPEIYGAEHLLYARASDAAVEARLRDRIDWWDEYTTRNGMEMNNNPSPGNIAGGLTTILEKSLGAVAKAGTGPLEDVILYGEPLRRPGLVFMDSPGFDPCSATGQVASGATIIAFTTGRGSAFGFKPSPSIKIASNSDVAARMSGDIDIDCGPIADGASTIEEKGEEILDYLLDIASGRQSKSEALGYGGSEFVPWLIGATM